MRKVLAFDGVAIPAWPDTISSTPIPVSTASTKLFIDIKMTLSKGDGAVITLEFQDEARDYWSTVSDLGGATSPGANDIYAFEYQIKEAGAYLLPVPQRLIAQGDYRIVLKQFGMAATTGEITAYLKTGEY